MLEQVSGFRARLDLDALAFAQAGQGLQGLADEDDAPLGFLLVGEKVSQFLLGGLVSVLILVGTGHGRRISMRDSFVN